MKVLTAIVHIEGRKTSRGLSVVARGQVNMKPTPIPQPPTLKVELLHPAMGNGGYPSQLQRLVEVSDHEIGVLPPHTIVSGMETEGIRDHPPVDD
jgi:hypothetical protein